MYNQLFSLGDIDNFDLIFDKLETLQHDQRYQMVKDGVGLAAQSIVAGRPTLLLVLDDTGAGGRHGIKVLIDPANSKFMVEAPNEPTELEKGVKGGRYPTLCHAIELVVAIYKKADRAFPDIEFGLAASDYLRNFTELYSQAIATPIIMPLTIDPPKTNALIFHTQVPHINPEVLARSWYEVIKQDTELKSDVIRHTILVMPVSSSEERSNDHFTEDQPANKRQVYTEVLEKNVVDDRGRFRPMHLNRIRRWETLPELNKTAQPNIDKAGNRYVIYL